MPSDTAKLICIFCGHKQTVRLGAGLWWRCKGKPGQTCGKRNPGPTIVGDIVRSAIAAGQVVVGKAPKKNVAPAGAAGEGTTVGRRVARVAQTEQPAANRKVEGSAAATPKEGRRAPAPAATKESSAGATTPPPSRGLWGAVKELIV